MAFFDLTMNTNTPAVTTTTVAPATPAVITVPVASAAPATTTTPATTSTTTNPLPLVTKTAEKDLGLSVEKTTTSDEKTPHLAKKGPSLDKALTAFNGKKYINASAEDKEKMIVKYFDWLDKKGEKSGVNQLKQFELYRDRCTDPAEYKRLSGVIDKMQARYQLSAIKTVTTKGTEAQKDIGQRAVGEDLGNYDKSVQVDASKILVETKNTEAIKIGASHAAETDKANQTEIVKNFQSIDNVDINKVLINQYGQYAKENEIGIHTIMSGSQHAETVEYAASKIGNFDVTNQAQALRITQSTGNEKAIANANASIDDAETETDTKEETETEPEEKTASNNIKEIINSDSLNKNELIKDAFKTATAAEKATWIETLSPNELANMINIIPLSELPMGKVLKLMDRADSKSQKELVERINSTYLSNVMDFTTVGVNIQNIYAEKAAKTGKAIDKNMLSLVARQNYNEILKEQNKG